MSGNPGGRPKGVQDKRSKLRQALEKDAGEIIAVMVSKAKAGDHDCARFLLSRLLPPAKDLPISVPSTGTLAEQGSAILREMMAGRITASDGNELMAALTAQVRIVELSELERRLAALELRITSQS